MRSIYQFSFKRIAYTFFFHNMDIKRFYQQTYLLTHSKMMIVLYNKFITIGLDHHFIMHTFKDG